MPESLRDSLGAPSIATVGAVYSLETVALMMSAADELNITLEVPRYIVFLGDDSMFDEYGKKLPDGYTRVHVVGSWVEDNDLSELWDRTKELRDEAR